MKRVPAKLKLQPFYILQQDDGVWHIMQRRAVGAAVSVLTTTINKHLAQRVVRLLNEDEKQKRYKRRDEAIRKNEERAAKIAARRANKTFAEMARDVVIDTTGRDPMEPNAILQQLPFKPVEPTPAGNDWTGEGPE